MSIFRYYTTLARAKEELKATTTTDDSTLLNLIQVVSSRVDGIVNPARIRPYFSPYIETRRFPVQRRKVNTYDNTFSLKPHRLLSFTAVNLTDSDNSTDVTADTALYSRFSPNIDYLRLTNRSRTWYDRVGECYPPYDVTVAGTWGYHVDYDNAWEAIATITADVSSAADTTITVDSAANISPGALLRINAEFFGVTAVSGVTITVKRGVNGSTATTHTSGDNVERYLQDDRIVHEVARQTGLLYARRGAYQIETLDGVGAISYPRDLLVSLRVVLSEVMHGS